MHAGLPKKKNINKKNNKKKTLESQSIWLSTTNKRLIRRSPRQFWMVVNAVTWSSLTSICIKQSRVLHYRMCQPKKKAHPAEVDA